MKFAFYKSLNGQFKLHLKEHVACSVQLSPQGITFVENRQACAIKGLKE